MRVAAGLALTLLLVACTDSRAPPPETALRDSSAGAMGRVPARLLAAAESVYFRSEYDSAWTLYRQARDRARSLHDSTSEARALTWLGLTAWRQGRYADARRLGEEALALKLRLGLAADLFRSYNALGLLAWNEGRLEDATALFDTAGHRAAAIGDAKGGGVAAGNLALVHTELGEFAAARRGFLAARDAGHSAGDARVEGNALTNLGMLAIRVGDPGAAIPFLHEARRRYGTIGYVTGDQNALGQLGTAYAALGEPRLAIAALDSALAQAREQGLKQDEASDLEALAEQHRAAGDYQRALDLYAEAMQIDVELGANVELGADRRSVAEIHAALGDYELADEYARLALESHTKAGARYEALADQLLLAELAHRAGQRGEAVRCWSEARRLARQLGTRAARLPVALAEARSADRARENLRVLRVLDETARDLSAGGFEVEWEAHTLRSRALARLGRLREAEAAGRQAVAAVERVRGNYGSGLLRTSYAAERLGAYTELVRVLVRQRRVADAFEVSDAARGRALLEHLLSSKTDSGVSPVAGEDLLRQISQLAFNVDSLERELAEDTDSGTVQAIRFMSTRLERARADYEGRYVRAAEQRSRDPLLGVGQLRALDLQSALRPDEAILEYLVTPERVIGFAVTHDTVVVFETALTAENLESRIRLAREMIRRKDDPPALAAPVLAALYDALIAPAVRSGALAATHRLVVVPHGVLAYLPFAALRDSGGVYLVRRYSLLFLPSAAALPVLRRVDRSRPTGAAAMSAAVFAPDPDRFPATRGEAAAVRRAVRGALVLLGDGATEARVRGALAEARLVHVAGHGMMNAANPLFSRVELHPGSGERADDDGRLEVHEVLDVQVASGLVFLSGCETGLGRTGSTVFARGEDFTSLAQAFLHAGAQDVVATLWPVEDEGAAVFAAAFYGELGQTPAADALARAQRRLLSQPRYSAPFYWAAYELSGDGGALAEQRAPAVSVTPKHPSSVVTLTRSEP